MFNNFAAKVMNIRKNNYQLSFLLENLQIQTNLLSCANEFNLKRTVSLGSSCIYQNMQNLQR